MRELQTWVISEAEKSFIFFSDCAADKTPCDGSTICLTTYDICDGWDDCADGSDEAVCG